MSEDARATAYRQMMRDREAFYAALDDDLMPPSSTPANLVRDRWEPIEQFVSEGPDVGDKNWPESEAGQRIN